MAEETSPKPAFKRPLSFYLWLLAGAFLIFNLLLLFIPNSSDEAVAQSAQELEKDTQAFDRLSFWQQITSRQNEDSPEKLSVFDGLPIDAEYEESAVSVMVDNFVGARAQHSGVRSASIVYEALAEGGITRLMLVFPYQEISRVGPVRSARDYFVDFAEEYGGLYVHAGGSPLALEKLWASTRLYDVDEDVRLEGETYSFRDNRYFAPHNLFFDLLLVRERATRLEWNLPPARTDWCFESEAPAGISVGKLQLDFANDGVPDSQVEFVYDAEQQHYKRFYGFTVPKPHTDQHDALQVAPANIVVQITPSELIAGDEKERLSFHHIGTGKAFFFRNGVKVEGIWKKPSADQVTKFFDLQGDPVCLLPGQTWIALLNDESLLQEE